MIWMVKHIKGPQIINQYMFCYSKEGLHLQDVEAYHEIRMCVWQYPQQTM